MELWGSPARERSLLEQGICEGEDEGQVVDELGPLEGVHHLAMRGASVAEHHDMSAWEISLKACCGLLLILGCRVVLQELNAEQARKRCFLQNAGPSNCNQMCIP